jgi:hypothetical protein
MADITDPIAIKFCNEVVRPFCEAIRAQHFKTEDASTAWNAGTGALFPNDPTAIVLDGREDEGINPLDGALVNQVYGVFLAMDAAYNSELITIPCVRSL